LFPYTTLFRSPRIKAWMRQGRGPQAIVDRERLLVIASAKNDAKEEKRSWIRLLSSPAVLAGFDWASAAVWQPMDLRSWLQIILKKRPRKPQRRFAMRRERQPPYRSMSAARRASRK